MLTYNNLAAMNSMKLITSSISGVGKALERLSSGLRINHASDDAAGLSISERMRSQIRGASMQSRNSQDSISMMQTAEGGLSVMGDMVQRMRELAVQAGNGTLTSQDRELINEEFNQLKAGLNDISTGTEYNTHKILSNINTTSLGLDNVNLISATGAGGAITSLDNALSSLVSDRASLGAQINRQEYRIQNLATTRLNLTAAEPRTRDAYIAQEVTNLTNNMILANTGIAMLAQANQQSKNILRLIDPVNSQKDRYGYLW